MTKKFNITQRLESRLAEFRDLRVSQAESRAELDAWLSRDERYSPTHKTRMRDELRNAQAAETRLAAKLLWQLTRFAQQETAQQLADVKSADKGRVWDYNRLNVLSREYAAALRRRPPQYATDEDFLASLAQEAAARGDAHERRALALAVQEHSQELSQSKPYRALTDNPAADLAEQEVKSAKFLAALAQGEINRSMTAFVPTYDLVATTSWQSDVYGQEPERAPNAA